MRKKHLHHILISVALRQWQPHVSFRWYGSDHIDPVTHHSLWHRVVLAPLVPTCPSVISRWYPGFVDVYNEATLVVDLKHLLCVETAQDSVLFRVSHQWNPLDFAIAQPKLLFHRVDDSFGRHIEVCLLLNLKFNLLGRPNALLSV